MTGSDRPTLTLRRLGLVDYAATWGEMRAFTDARTAATGDELWLLQHPPVFTLGQAGGRNMSSTLEPSLWFRATAAAR